MDNLWIRYTYKNKINFIRVKDLINIEEIEIETEDKKEKIFALYSNLPEMLYFNADSFMVVKTEELVGDLRVLDPKERKRKEAEEKEVEELNNILDSFD